jgi:hypothetical protein
MNAVIKQVDAVLAFAAVIEDPNSSSTATTGAMRAQLALVRDMELAALYAVPPAVLETFLKSGPAAVRFGSDPDASAFIHAMAAAPPTPALVALARATLAVKTFPYSASHVCAMVRMGWPDDCVANVGTHIVRQSRAGLVCGNIPALGAILFPEKYVAAPAYFGEKPPADEWCCARHFALV